MQSLAKCVAAALLATLGSTGWAQNVVTELGLRAAPVPVREDPRWAPDGPFVVRVLSPQQLASLQEAAGGVALIGVGVVLIGDAASGGASRGLDREAERRRSRRVVRLAARAATACGTSGAAAFPGARERSSRSPRACP